MLLLSDTLLSKLKKYDIKYCHWKSNMNLSTELNGGELDLFVENESKNDFESLIGELGFIKAFDSLQSHVDNVHHFYGMDRGSGKILHLHVFYDILTGESISKNLNLKLDDLLLKDLSYKSKVVIPSAKVELIIFLIRIFSKHQSIIEYLLLLRDYGSIKKELLHIEQRMGEDKNLDKILKKYFNGLPEKLIKKSIQSIKSEENFFSKYLIAKKINKYIKKYARYNRVMAFYLRNVLVLKYVLQKLVIRRKTKVLSKDGFVCAIAGPDATGKSTMVKNLNKTLAKDFKVEKYHLGKPKSSFLTIPFNLISPIIKIIFDEKRNTQLVKNKKSHLQDHSGLIQSISSIVLAYDRLKLTKKIFKKAKNGSIVICDRWPSKKIGAMDSPRIRCLESSGIRNKIIMFLQKIEQSIYGKIQNPNLIIQLTVPIEIAIERNTDRKKNNKEDNNYIVERHDKKYLPDYSEMNFILFDTSESLNESISKLKYKFWEELLELK
jgi:thymidylate kinase